MRECVGHELVQPFQVLYERPGSVVCHVKFTVLLLPSGTVKVTGLDLPVGQFVSEGTFWNIINLILLIILNSGRTIPEEIQTVLNTESAAESKKKKKKAKKAAAEAGDA